MIPVYRWKVTQAGWVWMDMEKRQALNKAGQLLRGSDAPVTIARYRKISKKEQRALMAQKEGVN